MKKILLSLFVITIMVSCNKPEIKKEVKVEKRVPIVKTEELKLDEISEKIKLAGDVIASNSVDIYPDVPGKVDRLIVHEGDYVKKGDIVAYIDRNKPGMNFALSPVESPITGTITQVIGKVGSMAAQSVPLFKIGTLNELDIVTNISERDINRVELGLNADIFTETYPDIKFTATVNKLNPVVNPITRTMKTVLKLNNNKDKLKPGMFVDIELTTKHRSKTIVINKEHIIYRNGESFIWKYLDEKVYLTPVTFGLENEQFVEVLTGIKAGDFIVTGGFTYLEEGLKVKVLDNEEVK